MDPNRYTFQQPAYSVVVAVPPQSATAPAAAPPSSSAPATGGGANPTTELLRKKMQAGQVQGRARVSTQRKRSVHQPPLTTSPSHDNNENIMENQQVRGDDPMESVVEPSKEAARSTTTRVASAQRATTTTTGGSTPARFRGPPTTTVVATAAQRRTPVRRKEPLPEMNNGAGFGAVIGQTVGGTLPVKQHPVANRAAPRGPSNGAGGGLTPRRTSRSSVTGVDNDDENLVFLDRTAPPAPTTAGGTAATSSSQPTGTGTPKRTSLATVSQSMTSPVTPAACRFSSTPSPKSPRSGGASGERAATTGGGGGAGGGGVGGSRVILSPRSGGENNNKKTRSDTTTTTPTRGGPIATPTAGLGSSSTGGSGTKTKPRSSPLVTSSTPRGERRASITSTEGGVPSSTTPSTFAATPRGGARTPTARPSAAAAAGPSSSRAVGKPHSSPTTLAGGGSGPVPATAGPASPRPSGTPRPSSRRLSASSSSAATQGSSPTFARNNTYTGNRSPGGGLSPASKPAVATTTSTRRSFDWSAAAATADGGSPSSIPSYALDASVEGGGTAERGDDGPPTMLPVAAATDDATSPTTGATRPPVPAARRHRSPSTEPTVSQRGAEGVVRGGTGPLSSTSSAASPSTAAAKTAKRVSIEDPVFLLGSSPEEQEATFATATTKPSGPEVPPSPVVSSSAPATTTTVRPPRASVVAAVGRKDTDGSRQRTPVPMKKLSVGPSTAGTTTNHSNKTAGGATPSGTPRRNPSVNGRRGSVQDMETRVDAARAAKNAFKDKKKQELDRRRLELYAWNAELRDKFRLAGTDHSGARLDGV